MKTYLVSANQAGSTKTRNQRPALQIAMTESCIVMKRFGQKVNYKTVYYLMMKNFNDDVVCLISNTKLQYTAN